VVRLDDVVERADFIKIDVEGAEELVLLGAARVVESRPRILFEVNREAAVRLGLAPEGAWELLRQLGYRFFRVVGRDLKPLGTAPHGGNVLALAGVPGGCG